MNFNNHLQSKDELVNFILIIKRISKLTDAVGASYWLARIF